MKKARLIVSIITCFFAVAVLCFGVFAAVSASFSLGGQLEYEVNNAFVDIETKIYRYKDGITDVNKGAEIIQSLKDMSLETIEANKSRLNLANTPISIAKYSSATGQGSSLNSISLKYDDAYGFAFIVVVNIQNVVSEHPAYAVVSSANPPPNSWYIDSSGQAKIEPGDFTKNIVFAFGLHDIKVGIESGSTFSYSIACGKYEPSNALQYTTYPEQTSELPNSPVGAEVPQQTGAYVDVSGIDTSKIDSSVLIIPDQYGGVNVTTMSATVSDITSVTSVIFGENIITTPDMSGFKNLVSVVFDGDGVTTMDKFDLCLKLTSITVPSTVTSLNLMGCTSLGGVMFRTGFAMTEFASSTFKNCISLSGISIPDVVTALKSELFNGCINLLNISLPETLTRIEENVFTQTKYLENIQSLNKGIATARDGITQYAISVPTTVTDIILLNAKVIARYALKDCVNISSAYLPSDLKFIGNYAFENWTNTQTIYQPNVVEYTPVIEPYAFANCNAVMGSHSNSSMVVFDTDGGDALENIQVPLSESEQQIELPTPVKEGYAFVEWQITSNTTPACRISNNKLIIPVAVLGQVMLKATYKPALGFLRSDWFTVLGLEKADIKEIYFQTTKPTGYESMTAKSVGANNEGTTSSNSQQAYDGTVCDDVTAYYTTHSSGSGYTIYITCPYTIYAPSYSCQLFYNFTALTTLDLANFNTSKVINMWGVFYNCSKLTSLDVSGFDTRKVTDMGFMFSGCSNLTSLDVSGFKTENVTNMEYMFNECNKLEALDVSGFKTENVTNMAWMFRLCKNLKSLNLSGFNTKNVTNMDLMFMSCYTLSSLDLSSFNTGNVTNMRGMFTECSGLTSLDVSSFDTSKVSTCTTFNLGGMQTMFRNCSNLTSLDVSNFNTSNVTGMASMFWGCSSLTSLDLSSFDMTKVTNVSSMLSGTTNLVEIVAPQNVSDSYPIDLGKNFYNKVTGEGPYTQITSANDSASTTNKTTLTTTNTISYELNGATISSSAPKEYTLNNPNTQIITLPTPTKDGCTFESWEITTNCSPEASISGNVLTIPANATGKIILNANFLQQAGYLSSSWFTTIGLTKTDIKEIYLQTTKPTGYESMTAKPVGANNEGTSSSNSQQAYDGTVCYDVTAYYTTHSSGTGYTIYITCPYTIFAPSCSYGLFRDFTALTILGLANFNTSKVTTMVYMIWGCSSLTILDVSNFDTSNVTEMYGMFGNCSGLTSLDVSGFDTSKVTSMSSMFDGCSGLTSLDVSGFDTSKVTSMSSMFDGCSGLTSLDVTNFDTSKVTGIGYMFQSCSNLTSLDVTNFDTSKVINMWGVFYNCSKLTSLDVSGFDTSHATNMALLFSNCSNLTSLDVSKWDTGQVTDMRSMFYNCSKLTSLDVSKFITTNVTDMSQMFFGCSNLTSLDVSNFNTSQVTNIYAMFNGCSNLTSLDVSKWDTSKVTSMYDMFKGCSKLTSLDVSKWDTSKVTNMRMMFYGCSSLTSLDLSNFDMTNVTDVSSMLPGTTNLVEIVAPRNVSDGRPIELGKNFYNKVTGEGPYTQITSANCSTADVQVTLTTVFEISYDLDGGSVATENAVTYTAGASAQTITLTVPTKEGYNFTGWEIVVNTTTACSITDNTLTIPANAAGKLELKAIYTAL